MTDFGLKREMVESLVRGEQIQTLRVSVSDLADVLHDVNMLSSGDGVSENARSVTDKATLEAVQRLAQEDPFNDVVAGRLVFSLIGVSDDPKKVEAFETLFPYLSPEDQVAFLNEMRDELGDRHEWGALNPDEEVSGLLARHVRPEGGSPVTVGEVLQTDTKFALGPGNTIVFQTRDEGTPPILGAGLG